MFDKAVGKLTKMGLSQNQIEARTVTDTLDVAESILNEVKAGDYQMLVIGRHGYSKAKRFLMGSVASAIINRGAGAAICVVE